MPSSSKVPIPTLERLATYLRMLIEAQSNGVTTVSSSDVARQAGVEAAQFRKDLSYFGDFGTPGVGYRVSELHATIAKILKIDSPRPVLLIGAGNLGAALAGYPGFSENNLEIRAVFDSNQAKVGKPLWTHAIKDVEEMDAENQHIGARIAILSVPGGAAQDVADRCVSAGIKVMLNFTPATIRVPKGVFVRNVSFVQELAVLSYYVEPENE